MAEINKHTHMSGPEKNNAGGQEASIHNIQKKTLGSIRDVFAETGKIDPEDLGVVTQQQNVIFEIKNILKNKECENLSPLIRKIFFDILSWNKENINNYAIIETLVEIKKTLPSLQENALACLILYAYFQQIESIPEDHRHFFDVAVDPRILADKGFSLEECITLFSKTSQERKLDENDFLELFGLMTKHMELFRKGTPDQDIEEELLEKGFSPEDISPHGGKNYTYTRERFEVLRRIIEEYHLDLDEIQVLSFAKNYQTGTDKTIDYVVERLNKKTGKRNPDIYTQLESITERDDAKNPEIKTPLRCILTSAIQKTLAQNTSMHQLQGSVAKSIFNKLHGLKEHIQSLEIENAEDMNLAHVYIDRSDEGHQGYLNTAQIGFHFRHLEALQKIYQFWIQKGVPSKVYGITKKLYEKAFQQYAKKMGVEKEIKAFHFASGSTAIKDLVQFLPKGKYITTNRDYTGNIKSIRETCGEKALQIVNIEKTENMAKKIKECVEKTLRENPKEKIYLFIPEVSFDGTVFPIAEMKKYCHENNITLIVDSCQAIGCKKTEFGDINIFSHQKANGLPDPAGTVIMDTKSYTKLCAETAKSLEPKGTVELKNMLTIIHVLMSMQDENTLHFGDPLESILHGYNKKAGIRNTEKILLEMQRELLSKIEKNALLKNNIEIITAAASESPGRLSFRIKGWVGKQAVDEMTKLGIQATPLLDYGKEYEDAIRISFSHLQSKKSIDKLIKALETIIGSSLKIKKIAQEIAGPLREDESQAEFDQQKTQRVWDGRRWGSGGK